MEVRGKTVTSIADFVKNQFRTGGFTRWVNTLPGDSLQIMTEALRQNGWFPFGQTMVIPVEKVCQLFYEGDARGAWEIGRFAAQQTMSGITSKMAGFASIQFVIQKFLKVFDTYYRPGHVQLLDQDQKSLMFQMQGVDEWHQYLDYSVAGWAQAFLEMCQLKNVKVQITKQAAENKSFSEFVVSWGLIIHIDQHKMECDC